MKSCEKEIFALCPNYPATHASYLAYSWFIPNKAQSTSSKQCPGKCSTGQLLLHKA